MRLLYNLLTHIAAVHLWIAQLFSKKVRLFVKGRKDVFHILEKQIGDSDKTVWFHCASLGEFEQGVPIMEEVKNKFSDHKLVVSFFSPSGYEIKKDTEIADTVVYLPLDTPNNAKRFLKLVHPSLAVFVKYEFWPNYLFELQKLEVPTLLVSALFRKRQSFFKPHGFFMRRALRTFTHLFVQDSKSVTLLNSIEINNHSLSGDTRFDRVSHQIEQDNSLPFIEEFKQDSICIVCGSTWPEDEALLKEFINSSSDEVKFIVAPHKILDEQISDFRESISKKSVLYSEREQHELSKNSVLIIDNIGLLSKIYSYADIAYVGGAMGSWGLHNILEPATFGIPIIIGNNYNKFPEAIRLQQLAGLYSVANHEECSAILDKLVSNKNFRIKTGMISGHFVNSNTGATKKIMTYIDTLHADGLI